METINQINNLLIKFISAGACCRIIFLSISRMNNKDDTKSIDDKLKNLLTFYVFSLLANGFVNIIAYYYG